MARVTRAEILNAKSDSKLLELLFAQLSESAPPSLHEDLDRFVAAMGDLPAGLRAMASTYQLDVSMALDDLGWHFANWRHHGYCQETSRGLKELGARELAEVFDAAYAIAREHWDEIGEWLQRDASEFAEWYPTSRLHAALDPLNQRMWDLLEEESPGGESGIFRFWLAYARNHPAGVAP